MAAQPFFADGFGGLEVLAWVMLACIVGTTAALCALLSGAAVARPGASAERRWSAVTCGTFAGTVAGMAATLAVLFLSESASGFVSGPTGGSVAASGIVFGPIAGSVLAYRVAKWMTPDRGG